MHLHLTLRATQAPTPKMDDNVAQFMSITNQSAEVARGCLSMNEGDVVAAVNMFFEDPEIANSLNHSPSAAAASSNTAPATSSRSQGASRSSAIGRQDDQGVIHIDDDDDDELNFDNIPDESDSDLDPAGANNLQRIAQESDDAAMARRLQEEMYGGGGAGGPGSALGPDGVRAPIARTTETLVAPSGYGGYPGGGVEGEDEEGEAFLHEMRRRAAPRPSKSQTQGPDSS